ncbi:GspH/FimT family pseudopilin [Desulfonatronum lacustre]|uniref:GspH/FimT family pseudopilin n=1 Tax=Desulfonatronum lacustre TaxID=66849 RepID=UPI0009FDF89C|nr:GspH/FimT family pseudopilin [Desulfonatronum lacustre]
MPSNDAMTHNDRTCVMVKRNTGGLTIIEVLVVVAIISIMSGIGLFYINSASFRLQSEARNIRSALFHARIDAIKTNSDVTMKFYTDKYDNGRGNSIDLSGNGLSLSFSGGGALPTGGYTVTFSPSGTTANSNYHLTNLAGDKISIQMNSVGRIWLERL